MSKIKSEFRTRCKTLRLNHRKKFACEETFLKSRFYIENDVFLMYASVGSEADTFKLIEKAICDQKKVFLPKVLGEEMEFYRVTDVNNLVSGAFGVMEPTEVGEYSCEQCVCIVPGVAFDSNCNRLGYGKGYYDKFLSRYPDIIKIGFCSGCCFFDEIPTEENDIKMDYVFVDDTLIGI